MIYTVKDGEVAEFKGRNYTGGKSFEYKSEQRKDIHILKKPKKVKKTKSEVKDVISK